MAKNKVRVFRMANGLTQQGLVAKTHKILSQTVISLIENGHRTPGEHEKAVLAAALGAPVEALFPFDHVE